MGLTLWIFQTGEPVHTDGPGTRPMRAMNLADSAIAAGHQVVLWTSDFYHQEKKHRFGASVRKNVSDSLSIQFVKSSGYKRNISIGRFWDHISLAIQIKKLLKGVQPPDVAVIGYPPIEPAWVMTRWMNKAGVPVVCDVKDQWPDYFLTAIPGKLRPIGRIILSPLFYLGKSTLRNATGISSISSQFLDWSVKRAGRNQTEFDLMAPLVARNVAVDPLEISKAKDFWDKQGLDDNYQFKACFIGSLSPAFNFNFLEQVDKSDKWQFLICGTGSEYESLRGKFHNGKNVIFPGWVDLAQASYLTSVADIALAPYRSEKSFEMSVPNKIYDYLRAGLPIVSSLRGETENLLSTYSLGFTYQTNDEILALLESVENSNGGFLTRCKEQGQRLSETNFSFANVYGGYVSHLENLSKLSRH
jgi:glycosyltransferase involved in cell wall biosynthesis